MRTILITLMLVLGLSAKAQITLDYENPTIEVDNKVYTLISSQDDKHIFKYDVYHSNGKISQTGFFKDGKPDGVWCLYNEKGDLLSTMIFKNGNRVKLETSINGEEVTVVYFNNKPVKRVSVAYLD
jgi:antitoxin component YwqK of YwqJK toxin-antitoxin module